MELPKKINDEVWEYCRLNNITDVNGFIQKMFKQGFTVEKFGATPSERIVEKEVEKIVEIEVEKEVEKIVEVIKEIEVIKEVKVTDDIEMDKVFGEIDKLKDLVQTKEQRINELNLSLIEERFVSEDLNKNLSIEKLRGEKLNESLYHQSTTSGERGKEILKLKETIKELAAEINAERKKPKEQPRRDIYGENNTGTYGSNTSDL